MSKIMEQLRALQRIQFDPRARIAEASAMEALRAAVPAAILAHYERLVLRGKKGVASVRNGVCGECHLRLPGGRIAGLVQAREIQVCDNCGRYLYLPADEPCGLHGLQPAPAAPAARVSEETAHPVA